MNCHCGHELTYTGDLVDYVGGERTHARTYICEWCGSRAVFHWGDDERFFEELDCASD